MSLPTRFVNACQYFQESVYFLQQYHWLYNYNNTSILVENVFDRFPQHWKEELLKLTYDELSHLPLGYQKKTFPEDLKLFFDLITSLKPEEHELSVNKPLNPANRELFTEYMKDIGPKKQHEICNLANIIRKECGDDIKVIIDLGSGLGCLDQLLHGEFNYYVMGFEANKSNVDTAIKRQLKYYYSTCQYVQYVHHYVNEMSADTIIHHLNKAGWPYQSGICITGLHACADLTITAIKLFKELHFAKKIAIMPCCYHKMKLIDDPESQLRMREANIPNKADFFYNFPLSAALKQACVEKSAHLFLRRPFLRLACQHSHELWSTKTEKDHLRHAYGLLSRAVLELFKVQEQLTMQKQKRKLKLRDSRDIETILNEYKEGYIFHDKDGKLINLLNNRNALMTSWNNQIAEDGIKMVEVLTAIQVCLQRVCENLILFDKIQYLNECNLGITSEYVKVTDDTLSPRCYGLVATKPKSSIYSHLYNCNIL